MYYINKYTYIDENRHSKFVVFSGTVEFIDTLIEPVNKLGTFSFLLARLTFYKKMQSELPPYST